MIQKQFFKNVLPSMLAFAFSGVYVIVDGLFVGRNIGDMGLAAINLAYPATAFVQAIGTGVGLGGSVLLAIAIGQKQEAEERRFLGNTLTMLLLLCFGMSLLLWVAAVPILRLFGAEGQLLTLATEYIRIMVLGSGLQLLTTGLIPIVRNYNGAMWAMWAMMLGFFTNVVLDWLFIFRFQWGMAGAAWATVIGQTLTLVPSIFFLWKQGKLGRYPRYKLALPTMKKIGAVALSPFGLSVSPNLIIIVMNKSALLYGGAAAAACYAVVSYVTCVVQLLLQGIGDGCQPLISRHYGSGEHHAVQATRRLAFLFGGAVALLNMAALFLWQDAIPLLFGASPAVAAEAARALVIFSSGFLFISFLRALSSYFYAVRRNTFAYVLVYGEPLLLVVVLTCVCGPLWGLNGVWAAVPLTQGLLILPAILLLRKEKKLSLAAHLAADGGLCDAEDSL